MLRPVMTGMLVTMERRGLIEIFPKELRNFWKKWQLRFLVFFSLSLQISLIVLGKLRKHNGKPWLRFAVWSAYLLADWVATVALGVICNHVQSLSNNTVSSSDDLMSFWASFLVLHLGGPDTITAYSVEDNQLWQRRWLELLTQMTVAGYVLLMALSGFSLLNILNIIMLLAGVIKFGERIHALRSASTEQFRLSQLTKPDPGPNYPKFMEEFTLKKAEGFYVEAIEVIEPPLPYCVPVSDNNEQLVRKAYDLFQTFKRLFVDLILSFQERDESQYFFRSLEPEKAFEVIEIELGFAYDVFYTKAPAIYNRPGHILRLITFCTTVLSLGVFVIISPKFHHHKIDLILTYLLLGVAIILEVLSCIIFVLSDWSDYWLTKHFKKSIISWFKLGPWKRWSNMIAQHSIRNYCKEERSSNLPRFLKFFMVENKVDELFYVTYKSLSSDLKVMIFEYFVEISKCSNKSGLTALCMSRGKRVLENTSFNCSNLNWSVTEVEFDQSILIWHIATHLCYYTEVGENSDVMKREESKHMSEYMLYLLTVCPFMLPMGIGMIRFRDTCAEAWEFFKECKVKPDISQACKMLLRVNTEIQPGKVKGDRSKSVLFDGCRVATFLRSKDHELKWKIISHVWIEILAYAACHCQGIHHAQQLRKGGEFLTHIWLLMAHLGITEQFQISQGHARAKLSAK